MRKALLENDSVMLSARLLLGAVFVFASIDKIADPNAFAISISYYRLVGEPLTLLIATILPWVELLAGLFLLFGIMIRGSSLLIVLMLVIFTAGVISGIARDLDIACGCFSRDPYVDRIGWKKVMENVGLMILALIALMSQSRRFTVAEPLFSRRRPKEEGSDS